MSDLRQRDPRQEDRAHLAFVRAQPCCVCGSTRNVEAAHLKMRKPEIGKESPGMQQKAHDMWVTPLCAYHHRIGIDSQHNNNERKWWTMRGLNPFEIAANLWRDSGGEERAAMPQPVKRPRKIKARKPPERRRKVGPSRPLKSNPIIHSRGFQKPAGLSTPSGEYT